MSQQAKDIYSGIKKIFPSSRRSGSFSLGSGRSSSTTATLEHELSAEAFAAAHEGAQATPKKKERRTSFSFSGWKERRSSLSTKKKELSTPPPEEMPPPPLTRSTSTSSTSSRASRASRASRTSRSEHSGYGALPTIQQHGESQEYGAMATSQPMPLSRSTSHPVHVSSSSSSSYSYSSSSRGSMLQQQTPAPKVLTAPAIQKQQDPLASSRTSSSLNTSSSVLKSSSKNQPEPVVTRTVRSQSIVPELPSRNAMGSRTDPHRASYNGHSNTNPLEMATRTRSSYSTADIGPRSVTAGTKEKRRTSFSFSRHRHNDDSSKSSSSSSTTPQKMAVDDVAMIVKPHANTWDSDSDEEDMRRTTRGLEGRSVSMDFVEQNPTHLISKIWRKLPIQARLYSARGSIDLDMQKDRNSFSRSSTAKQQAEKLGHSNYNKPPSPLPNANVFGDKHIYFNQKIVYCPPEGDYIALENYDDVLVRVCNFATHDQRRTSTKVQEFLERSMAFLHGTKTKHGNVVSISNEEIRMWRRLARHDWTLEEITTFAELAEKTKQKEKQPQDELTPEKDSRSSSSVTVESDSDSDDQRRRRAAANQSNNNEDEDEDDDLPLPEGLNLHPLLHVVNSCVNFGEYLFAFDEIDELVRLEFLVEEDGWI
ncbi:hypothetical protein FI667_g6763, partial [Globisporangium splendens]